MILAEILGMAAAHGQHVEPFAEIRDYQMEKIKSLGISKVTYLAFTKPYGKWDSRPLAAETVTINGERVPSRGVPNYLWGFIGRGAFALPREEILGYPEYFLQQSYICKPGYITHLRQNTKELLGLVSEIRGSQKSIFVQQAMLKEHSYDRIDNVFREKGEYWRYIIPPGSPYQMSGETEELTGYNYSAHDTTILTKMKSLKLYCAVKTPAHIVMMSGGMLDNSCGYIYTATRPTPESMGQLYHLQVLEPLGNDFYFYISN